MSAIALGSFQIVGGIFFMGRDAAGNISVDKYTIVSAATRLPV